MPKLFISILILSGFFLQTACSPQNERGYASNPKATQKAMANCPARAPSKQVSCEKLQEIAIRINQLAYKLRLDQQAYGKDILALQEQITAERNNLAKDPKQVALQKSLKQNEQDLQEHLAVVRWLASPER